MDASVPRGVRYTTATAYDDAAHALTVTDPRGTKTVTRLDGLDRPFEQTVDPGGPRARHPDELRRPRQPQVRHRPERPHHPLPARRPRPARRDDRRPRPEGVGRLRRRGAEDQRDRPAGGQRAASATTTSAARGARPRPRLRSGKVAWSQETRYRTWRGSGWRSTRAAHATTFDLDGLDRVVKETDALGHFRTFRWDGVNKREETDKRPAHHVTRFEYDALNRLKKVTDPAPFDGPDGRDDVRGRAQPRDREGPPRLPDADRARPAGPRRDGHAGGRDAGRGGRRAQHLGRQRQQGDSRSTPRTGRRGSPTTPRTGSRAGPTASAPRTRPPRRSSTTASATSSKRATPGRRSWASPGR